MSIFTALLYVEYWFSAPSAIQAPRRDLALAKALLNYKTSNADVSKATVEKLQRHQCAYLNM